MSKEIKSVKVHPSEESYTVKVWQTFGWEFHSQQEGSNTTYDEDDENIYIKTTHFVKLVFQRDSEIPHYNELVTLENEYYNIYNPGYQPRIFTKPFLIPLGLAVLMLIGGGIGLGVLFIAVPIIFKIFQRNRWNKNHNDFLIKSEDVFKRANEL